MAKEKIESSFSLDELKLKEALWTIKITVGRALDQIEGTYLVRFVLDLKPFEDTVEKMRKRVEESKADQLSIDERENKQRMDDVAKDLKEAEKALKQAVKDFEDIEFVGVVTKMERKLGRTVLTLVVKAETVTQIDEHKHDLMPYDEQRNVYKLELTRHVEA
jgi:hypothetical protein